MASFRTLLPAPGSLRPDDGSDDGPPSMPHRPLLKRIRSVPQACQMCRQMKAKCDGGRPRCGNCIDRDRPCGYEGEAGQSRQAAMRSRLAAYERLFASLRTASPADADQLLHRLRVQDDPVAMLREVRSPNASAAASTPATPGSPSTRAPAPTPVSDSVSVSVSVSVSASASSASGAPLAVSSPTAASATGSVSSSGRENDMSASPTPTEHPATPSTAAAPPATSPPPVELALPAVSVAAKALSEFYNHCDRLHHVFSEDEAGRLYTMLYGAQPQQPPASVTEDSQRIAAACLASVIALGVQQAPDQFAPTAGRAAYDLAKHYFELAMDVAPFTAIKLTVMLAMFNVMTRNTAALMWIGIGLKLCRTHGLIHKTPVDPIIAMDEWTKLRRSWRSLIFLSCWLSFTVGSIYGQEVEFERINPTTMEFEPAPDIEEVVQNEFAKLSVLTVEILRVHLAFKEITVLSFESVLRDLRAWHEKLPLQLQLPSLPSLLAPETLRSTYRLHLLHLGAIILVYRRMASQFSCLASPPPPGSSRQILVHGLDRIPDAMLQQGITAARTSAHVLARIMDGQTPPRLGWIVIIQAYTCCIVILHVVAQRQLHRCYPDSWEADIQQARACLHVLNYNSAFDSVAKDFHGRLFPIFADLTRAPRPHAYASSSAGPYTLSPEHGRVGYETVSLLLTAPLAADAEHTRISLDLMAMLGRPFRNLWGKPTLVDDGRSPAAPNLGLPQLAGLDWARDLR